MSDLRDVIQHIRDNNKLATDIYFYGRSMGAVTALLYCQNLKSSDHENRRVPAAIVCDSPFSDLWTLSLELVESMNFKIPKFAIGIVKGMLRNSIRKRTGCDILDLNALKKMPEMEVPVLLCAAAGDNFVRPKHAQALSKP